VKSDKNGGTIRIKDVARVELGSKDYNLYGRINGHPSANIGVFLQTGANALETRKAVEKTLEDLKAKFPEGMSYATPYDTTPL
jgi:HAE1 family hydrophobic/amphiphilic exporter-1/multidrug efflux pump